MDRKDSEYMEYAAQGTDKISGRRQGMLPSAARCLAAAGAALLLTGCGNSADKREAGQEQEIIEAVAGTAGESAAGTVGEGAAGIARESAADCEVDFEALTAENPDIFAWIYIPETGIDCPVLQSGTADDFYETHDAYGAENQCGAAYIEMANLTDMTDFNTVIHGKTEEGGDFAGLYRYTDPEFFDKYENIYLYMDGNVLVYEVFAAYEREDSSLIRQYNFTNAEGCNAFLSELYARAVGKQIREGWEGLGCNHFLITLTTKAHADDDKQFVVMGALIEDAAGVIYREVMQPDTPQ